MPSAVLPSHQRSLRPSRRLTFSPPFGHPKSLQIAVVRAVCAKVRARAPQNAKKRTFGGPRVPKDAKMEPNWSEMGAQNVPKKRGSEKTCEMWFGPIIYNIFSLLAPSKNLTFCYLRATKMKVFFAWCLGRRPGAAKWRSRGRKMARVGSPREAKAAKGSPNAS